MSEPILRAETVAKTYRDGERELPILTRVDFALEPGEIVAILGRSGSGKSTLLHLLGLLDRPTSGEIFIQDRATGALSETERTRLRGRVIGFVFQQYHLLHEFTALENILLGGAVGRGSGFGPDCRARARELLAAVEMEDRADHKPGTLSGGERQRAAIARALYGEPAVLLCDEPTGNLDAESGAKVLDIFWKLARREKMATILVTHDAEVAKRADRVLRLDHGALAKA